MARAEGTGHFRAGPGLLDKARAGPGLGGRVRLPTLHRIQGSEQRLQAAKVGGGQSYDEGCGGG